MDDARNVIADNIRSDAEPESDDSLDTLREQYLCGAIDEAAFEYRMERLLDTTGRVDADVDAQRVACSRSVNDPETD